jgi:methionyl-tRNA formyltransferase
MINLVFAGTPVFAKQALAAVVEAGHKVLSVYTQPDRPAGRGQKLQASPVKTLAFELGLPVRQPATLRDAAEQQALKSLAPDLIVVAAYGQILPQAVLDIAPCVNIHASLLPRWRGAAPIQRAIEAGDTSTGITIMQMLAGLDTGPMMLKKEMPIAATDTGASLHDKLAVMGAQAIVEALKSWPSIYTSATPQPELGITYAHKLNKQEAHIRWNQPAGQIERQIRAFDPVPGCWVQADQEIFKVWAATLGPSINNQAPGTVLQLGAQGVLVACSNSSLWITQAQKPGGKRVPWVHSGLSLQPGQVLT